MFCKKIIFLVSFIAVFGFLFCFNAQDAKAMTAAELQALIQQLQAQILALQQQLAEIGGTPVAWCHTFNVNLGIGSSGEEALALKTALIKDGVLPNEAVSNEFDEETASYVTAFQEKYASEILSPLGLKHGTGYAGKGTRAKLNKIYGCGVTPTPTPSITVISPNGGETWRIGNNYDVTWKAVNLPSTCNVSVTLLNPQGTGSAYGGTATPIPASLGKYSFNVFSAIPVGNNYQIQVIGDKNCSGAQDSSDQYISVVAASTPSITVISPNGGEQWQLTSGHTILWTPYEPNATTPINSSQDVTAYLDKMGLSGNFVEVGKVIPAGKASIHWSGEINTFGNYAAPGDYYIRVVNNKSGATDRSDKAFKLVAVDTLKADLKINGSDGPITIPEGGATYNTTWTSVNVQYCNIYNNSANETFENLSSSGSKLMTFKPNVNPWDLPINLHCVSKTPIEGTASDNVLISRAYDLKITQPNGGESLDRTKDQYISLVHSSDINKVSVALYRDDKFFKWIATDFVWTNLGGLLKWLPSDLVSASEIGSNFKIYAIGYKYSGGTVEDKSDAPFSITAPQSSITVLSPNGGETWKVGEYKEIKFNATGVPKVKIFLKNDANQTTCQLNDKEEIGNFAAGSNSYYSFSFTVGVGKCSVSPGNKFKIEVYYENDQIDQPAVYDFSDNYFSIAAAVNPYITSFNYTETDVYNGSIKFYWTSTGADGVELQMSCHSGLTITDAITGANFLCGDIDRSLSPNSSNYLKFANTSGASINITATLTPVINYIGYGAYTKTLNFSIAAAAATTPSVTVISPNGGEKWVGGQTYNITWLTTNVEKINIVLVTYPNNCLIGASNCSVSCPEGSSCPQVMDTPVAMTIANGVSASLGKYAWIIPTTLSAGSNYTVKISNSSNVSSFDESNNYFSIAAATTPISAVETLRPNGAGALTEIQYQYPNSTYHWDKIDEASPDDGNTYIYNNNGGGGFTTKDLYTIPIHSVGSGQINKITVYRRTAQYPYAASFYAADSQSIIRTHGTIYEQPGYSEVWGSQGWVTNSYTWTANPYTGAAWTWDEIDALQIGVKLRSTLANITESCSQVYVEVDYTPTIAAGGTDLNYMENQLASISEAISGLIEEINKLLRR